MRISPKGLSYTFFVLPVIAILAGAGLYALLDAEAEGGPPSNVVSAVAAQADSAEPVTEIVVVLYPFEDELGPLEQPDGWLIAQDETEFASLLSEHSGDAGFIGTIVWTDGSSTMEWPPTDAGSIHLKTTVFDFDTLALWRQEEYTPGLLLDPPEILDDAPVVDEAVFDLRLWQQEGANVAGVYHMRVRASDGGVALVSRSVRAIDARGYDEDGDNNTDRGFWWPWACCPSQQLFCSLFHHYCPWVCADCNSCVHDCWAGGQNPCHSCGVCGFSDVLCEFVPFAHCR